MRKKLISKRMGCGYSQRALARRLGYSNTYLSLVETGVNCGTLEFWEKMQDALHIPDAEMWAMMRDKDEV